MTITANKITGPNAGGRRQFPIRTPLPARVGQFCRWVDIWIGLGLRSSDDFRL